MTTARTSESTVGTSSTEPVLLMAFELSQRTWKLGFSRGVADRPRVRTVPAGARDAVIAEIAAAKSRWQWGTQTRVISCYEAGRDGFWLHRWLMVQGITNYVVDSASIEVPQRAKRLKTDRLDLGGLLNLLARFVAGDRRAWRTVRVPTVAQEDARQWHRQRTTLQCDRTRVINRIKSVLATLGVRLAVSRRFEAQLAESQLWDGEPIPPAAAARLLQEWRLLKHLEEARATIERRCAEGLDARAAAVTTQLQQLRAIGSLGARVLSTELFAWRQIRNGRQLSALVGLVPARYQSGDTSCDLGITRAGNAHVRRISVQLAWVWVQHQRDRALTQWYQRRFATGSHRLRRVGIVALARKLVVALWRYVDQGVVPVGARLKPV